MEIKKSVSIVITNNNCRHLLEEHLPYTLEAINNASVEFEMIIVDDCSTDGSVEFIRKFYPDIVLIVNPETKGFPHSNNKGIKIARCQLILLLNPAIKLAPDYFEQQWKYFLGWKTFGVMGRVLKPTDDEIVDAARLPKFKGLKIETDYSYYTANSSNRLLTFYLSGTNALIDAAKLKKTGGFYELFSPVCCGDMELSIRAWRVKWKCYYEHESVCWQQVSPDELNANRYDKGAAYLNLLYLHAIHLNGWSLKAWYIQIFFGDLLPALFSRKKWRWDSFREFRANKPAIQDYKYKVRDLMDENDSQTNLFSVVGKLKLSVSNKKIIKVKGLDTLTDIW